MDPHCAQQCPSSHDTETINILYTKKSLHHTAFEKKTINTIKILNKLNI